MKISSVYGQEVLSTEGKRGYVLSVHAEGGKIGCFICADENEKEFVLNIEDVVKFGEPIIFREGNGETRIMPPVRLGRPVFDEKGVYLGALEDFTFNGSKLINAKIGKKNYPAEGLVCGDAIILKSGRKLRYDVTKDGKIILKKGTALTAEALEIARTAGEYVQASLKSL